MECRNPLITEEVARIANKTGYPFDFLLHKLDAIIDVYTGTNKGRDSMQMLELLAMGWEWEMPVESDKVEEQKCDSSAKREKGEKFPCEMTEKEKQRRFEEAARKEFERSQRRQRWIESACHAAAPEGFAYIIHQPIKLVQAPESETAKIRKHNHDTLWAVLAGFAACGALVVVFGLIIIAILSYARG